MMERRSESESPTLEEFIVVLAILEIKGLGKILPNKILARSHSLKKPILFKSSNVSSKLFDGDTKMMR